MGVGGLQAHSPTLLRSESTPTIPTIALLQAGGACIDAEKLLLTCTVLGNESGVAVRHPFGGILCSHEDLQQRSYRRGTVDKLC